jgi:hypothetical protein
MIDGLALAARAIGDAARRELASEWGGPEPDARRRPPRAIPVIPESARRVTVRKP